MQLIEQAPWLVLVVLVIVLVMGGALLSFIPVRLWIEALAAGVPIGLFTLVGMRLRKVNPAAVVRPLVNATKAGLKLSVDLLEAHYLAGGNVDRVVKALISAD
jgi:uncharacterized protein YqfA (UPF0365 family)